MSDDVIRFTSGQQITVDVTAIERELAKLWREAPVGSTAQVTRAALWNLILRADGEEPYARAKKLVDAISGAVPARAIVLRADAPGDGPPIEARIEANFHGTEGGAQLLGSEEVTLLARGSGTEHFPSLVRSLRLPDLPTALVWTGSLPRGADSQEGLDALLEGVGRMIVDTGDLASALELVDLAQLVHLSRTVELADLGWLRLGSVRLLLASFFDPPIGAEPILRAKRVHLDCARHGAATAMLLLGWLACRLGWGRPERCGDRCWRAPRPGGEVRLEVGVRDVEAGRDGIYQLLIESETGQSFSITDAGPDALELAGSGLPTRVLAAPERSDAELLVAALGLRGRDPMFGSALACAAEFHDPRTGHFASLREPK